LHDTSATISDTVGIGCRGGYRGGRIFILLEQFHSQFKCAHLFEDILIIFSEPQCLFLHTQIMQFVVS